MFGGVGDDLSIRVRAARLRERDRIVVQRGKGDVRAIGPRGHSVIQGRLDAIQQGKQRAQGRQEASDHEQGVPQLRDHEACPPSFVICGLLRI